MKKSDSQAVIGILIVGSVIGLGIVLCNAFAYAPFLGQVDDWPDGGDFYPETYYRIDTDTIASDVQIGKSNVFSPTTTPLDFHWPENANNFQWSQLELIKIATAINKFAGMDNINEWGVLTVSFDPVCEENVHGFGAGYFVLFKPIWVKEQLYYATREIYIDLPLGFIRWGEGRIYPRPVFGWSSIRLDKFKITADKALMIAEENGGRQVRLDKGNNCSISVIGRDDEWLVLYSPFTEYYIDAYTGKITYIRND